MIRAKKPLIVSRPRPALLGIAAGSVCACLLLMCVGAASAMATEFVTKGNSVTVKGGPAILGPEGETVNCESSKGSGGVTSSKVVKVKVSFTQCKAAFSKSEKEPEAKITACQLTLYAEEAVIQEGCTIEAGECIVKQSSAQQLKGLGFGATNESESQGKKLESEVVLSVSTIPDIVNKGCEALGAKGGETGLLESRWEGQGVNLLPVNSFVIEGASPSKEGEYKIASTGVKFEFFNGGANTGRSLTCEKMSAEGSTSHQAWSILHFDRPSWGGCATDVLEKPAEAAILTVSKACEYLIIVWDGPSEPFRASAGWDSKIGSGTTCKIEAFVGLDCVITFGSFSRASTRLTNTGKTINKVEVKEGFGRPSGGITYETNGQAANKCGTNIPLRNRGLYNGTGLLEAVLPSEVKVIER